MNLEVTLAISAATAAEALSLAASLEGFAPNQSRQPDLIQDGIFGVAGILSKPVEHRLVVGFLRSNLGKLDPLLRSMVAQLEARLQLCPNCSDLPLFGGCLRKNCESADCRATRFTAGIDRALKFCYNCCEKSGRCQRCGTTFKSIPQPPNLQPGGQPAGHPSIPEPRRRGYYLSYLHQTTGEQPLKRGMGAKLRSQRIAEHKRITEQCAAELRKQFPGLRVTVIGPLIVNVYGKSIATLSRLPEQCGTFIRGEAQREPEPLLANPFKSTIR
jgi:hypothetical protein